MRTILGVCILLLSVTTACAQPQPDTAKLKVARAVKRIEQGLNNYPKQRQCFSCHHQAVGVMALRSAQQHGFEVDDDTVKKAVDFSLKTFRNKSAIAKGQGVGGDSTSVVYMLHMLAAVERPADDTTDALVDYLLTKQRKDGAWPIAAFGERPPTMGSLFTNVGLAMGALKKYGASEDADRQKKVDAAVRKGRDWLLANKPASTEDKVFHLFGLVDASVETKHIEAARKRLLEDQREDGGWAQLSNMSSDAYATATALVSLRRAGLATTDAAHMKGVKYLVDAQKDDGAWFVQTRTKPLQKYFDNGDHGGKSQFISFAATSWTVLAVLDAMQLTDPLKAKSVR